MLLRDCIRKINTALEDLGQKKAYDIKWPHYNRNGYCFQRIVSGATALGYDLPEDVPDWDHWLEGYRPGEFFWLLWKWKREQDGNPPEDVETHVCDVLKPYDIRRVPGGTVLGQVAAFNKVIT